MEDVVGLRSAGVVQRADRWHRICTPCQTVCRLRTLSLNSGCEGRRRVSSWGAVALAGCGSDTGGKVPECEPDNDGGGDCNHVTGSACRSVYSAYWEYGMSVDVRVLKDTVRLELQFSGHSVNRRLDLLVLYFAHAR